MIVLGYRDAGYQKALGCAFKDMAFTSDWAQLFAASGTIAIAYSDEDPAADFSSLLRHLQANAAALRIDEQRIAVFGVSGNGPVALSALVDPAIAVKCALFGWPFLMDVDDATRVGDSAKQWGFVNACGGKTIDDLRPDVPMFIARAGRDQFAGLNDALDAFVAKALADNLPLTLVNHPAAPHAFDLFDEGALSREIIRQMLAFVRFHLSA